MPHFAANLSFMFREWSFLDRFAAAADAGFAAVEYLFPYDHAPEAIAARLAKNNLTQALFNLPPGDFEAGERGIAAVPGRFDEVKAGVALALDYAKATGAAKLHMMAGIAPREEPACAAYRRSVAFAAESLAQHGIELLLEPINPRDMPGYFLDDYGLAIRLIDALQLENVKLQFDIYHRQILHGDVTMALRAFMPRIGHIQVASVPTRHEPDGEELNHPFLFDEIDRLGYQGFIGCEYVPRRDTRAGLDWFEPFRRRAG